MNRLLLLYPNDRSGLTLSLLSGSLPSQMALSRASAAGYVNASGLLAQAAIDTPRFDTSATTLAARGLLIEGQRTNLIYPSTPTASWTAYYTTATVNAATSPDGTLNAASLLDTTASSPHTYYPPLNFTTVSGTSYTFSVYLKADTAYVMQLKYANAVASPTAYANFNLSTGTVGTYGGLSGAGAVITPAGNGWYRCSITATATANVASTSGYVVFANNNASAAANPSYTGTGNRCYVYGAQIEAGAAASSLIQSTSAATTRATELLTVNVPSGSSQITYTFDDGSTQTASVSVGLLTVPTTLNRAWIARINIR